MSDALIIALVGAIPATLAAISSFINHGKISEVKGLVNGMGEARNVATQRSAFAEGQKETLAAIAAGTNQPTNKPQ